jgi:hypothetical protein
MLYHIIVYYTKTLYIRYCDLEVKVSKLFKLIKKKYMCFHGSRYSVIGIATGRGLHDRGVRV